MTSSPGPATPQVLEAMLPGDRRAARRLGLILAVAVALVCDLIAAAILFAGRVTANGDAQLDPAILLVLVSSPVISAAPFGWALAPRVMRARLRGKIGGAVAAAIGAVLLGDLIVSVALAASSGWQWFPVLVVVGAVAVGPFVFLFATLPAAVVWVFLLGLSQRRR